ncbi:uncharacterized protein Tco025E_05016 [Trypanosoma conorhini]|uniref:Present in the outer mitochondrial membrane proteome 8 n=1 Tax=Trypanosoma conorhini TaxID=83891 RepID=A0A422PGS3_9TRYP|nr:uncharacterized protein Tco025E_05016 [Trypanosoma conorhini]RNF16920.1 hypothetical protein Tco025E_05016 [Trypanosoma conorhini]
MAELDTTKISIITGKKADPKLLAEVGVRSDEVPGAAKAKHAQERRCNLCCMSYGLILSAAMVLMVSCIGTAAAIYTEKRVNYSLNGAMRQVGWIALPGVLAGTTLHYFLSEAMWSGKRNTWGQAWMKAIGFNSFMWCAGIGMGTLLWRKGLLTSSAGRRLYYRYPIPTVPLDARVLRSEAEFFTGMGWSYWLSGVVTGQVGYLSCVGFCVWNDRPYFMMNPHGGYAVRCMPRWRREDFARQANVKLSDGRP